MNLVFAISARSVDGPSIFQKMKDVIKAIVQKFGSNRFHYSVITFGDPFTTELSFDQQLPSDEDLQRVIGKTSVYAKVSRFSLAKWHCRRAKQQQRNVQKSVMQVHIFFLLIRSIDLIAVVIAVAV